MTFRNPFRPGAGHRPPYLAGRTTETREFVRLLDQQVILENLVLTGLRGVGKTVLLDTFKPLGMEQRWLWVGTDLSESTSISEDRVATRLITDLAVMTSGMEIDREARQSIGFVPSSTIQSTRLDYATLSAVYQHTPGLSADKLKRVLLLAAEVLSRTPYRGAIFAYDEAQNLSDHAERDQYPLSLLLDVFQSIQKQDVPFMLALTGLPTLFPRLVEARTFAERMFRVVFLDRLSEADSRDAILKPIQDARSPVTLDERSIALIVQMSAGYPYFIQFICREVYDAFIQGQQTIPTQAIMQKLDSDFFAGRWARATDRQRDLLAVVARLDSADHEFTVQEIAEKSKEVLERPFGSSHISQMLNALTSAGLIYKNRHGKYSFAVPLMNRFILRQIGEDPAQQSLPF
jgi:hypothetical protein